MTMTRYKKFSQYFSLRFKYYFTYTTNKFAGVGGGSLMDWQHIAKHVNQSLHEEETNFILHFTNNNFDLHDKDRTNKQLRKSMMTMGTNNGQF